MSAPLARRLIVAQDTGTELIAEDGHDDDGVIADTWFWQQTAPERRQEYARELARRWNAHESLVIALQGCLDVLAVQPNLPGANERQAVRDAAFAALDAARGEVEP